ncbi:ScyD/ScyE family protein [Candidatus Gracilibacteria bacterium]|nr:ScyD/ScyE family protein [Candidatus Gracilibacteria bacterium]
MAKHKRPLFVALALLVIVALVNWLVPETRASASQASDLQLVAVGLNNPRGLAFDGSEDRLLVAEAGSGGSAPCFAGPEGETCLGTSGAIARVEVSSGSVVRLVTGLPSLGLADPPGFNATGPHDIARIGDDEYYVAIGLGGSPLVRASLGAGANLLGHVVRVRSGGTPQSLTDLTGFEAANDVDGAGVDSNPYALALRADRLFAVDAGANTLVAIDSAGRTQVATMLPSRLVAAPSFIQPPPPEGQIPMQAVPNSAAVGPDGAIYIGELTGFPFPVGGANVYRIGANGEAELYASGFTNIIAIDFDRQGNLYVLEIAKDGLLAATEGPPTGRLVRVDRGSKAQTVIASERLIAPAGLLVGQSAIYISNFGVFPGQGQIVRIERGGRHSPALVLHHRNDRRNALRAPG